MKGLSTILAMILIVIIVVALIGLTYTFAANLFQTTSNTATSSVETTTRNMDKHVSVLGVVTCKNISAFTAGVANFSVIFTLRHDGSSFNINDVTSTGGRIGELSLMIDSAFIADNGSNPYSNITPSLSTTPLAFQAIKSYNLTFENKTGTTYAIAMIGTRSLRIISPAGEISEAITCTYT